MRVWHLEELEVRVVCSTTPPPPDIWLENILKDVEKRCKVNISLFGFLKSLFGQLKFSFAALIRKPHQKWFI